jgi:hypothetical protein
MVERTATTLKLRMDDRKQRILVSSTDADVTACPVGPAVAEGTLAPVFAVRTSA